MNFEDSSINYKAEGFKSAKSYTLEGITPLGQLEKIPPQKKIKLQSSSNEYQNQSEDQINLESNNSAFSDDSNEYQNKLEDQKLESNNSAFSDEDWFKKFGHLEIEAANTVLNRSVISKNLGNDLTMYSRNKRVQYKMPKLVKIENSPYFVFNNFDDKKCAMTISITTSNLALTDDFKNDRQDDRLYFTLRYLPDSELASSWFTANEELNVSNLCCTNEIICSQQALKSLVWNRVIEITIQSEKEGTDIGHAYLIATQLQQFNVNTSERSWTQIERKQILDSRTGNEIGAFDVKISLKIELEIINTDITQKLSDVSLSPNYPHNLKSEGSNKMFLDLNPQECYVQISNPDNKLDRPLKLTVQVTGLMDCLRQYQDIEEIKKSFSLYISIPTLEKIKMVSQFDEVDNVDKVDNDLHFFEIFLNGTPHNLEHFLQSLMLQVDLFQNNELIASGVASTRNMETNDFKEGFFTADVEGYITLFSTKMSLPHLNLYLSVASHQDLELKNNLEYKELNTAKTRWYKIFNSCETTTIASKESVKIECSIYPTFSIPGNYQTKKHARTRKLLGVRYCKTFLKPSRTCMLLVTNNSNESMTIFAGEIIAKGRPLPMEIVL